MAPISKRVILLVFSTLLAAIPVHAGAPSFMSFGYLPGGNYSTFANDVSADGSMVVGTISFSSGSNAIRWTASEGMVSLPFLSGSNISHGMAVSDDGLSLGGQSTPHAFRWRTNGELIDLGHLAPPGNWGAYSTANALSFDGNVAVGRSTYQQKPDESIPFIWRSSTGMQSLGCLPGNSHGEATDVSANGSVVVGWCTLANFPGEPAKAFRWSGSMTALGTLPGGSQPHSMAHGISSDGSTIVGESSSSLGVEAFRWNGNVMIGLGDFPGGNYRSRAMAATADGTVIVGAGNTALGDESFIWDSTNGMRNIRLMLESYGLNLSGWRLDAANAISGDGTTIVGYGRNPSGRSEGWVATLPEPGSVCLLMLGLIGRRRPNHPKT